MKTKAIKNGVLLLTIMMVIVLSCMCFLSLGKEVQAEVLNHDTLAVTAANATVEYSTSYNYDTIITVIAELKDGNRVYGALLMQFAVRVVDAVTFELRTVVQAFNYDYKTDKYGTEGYTFGYNFDNAGYVENAFSNSTYTGSGTSTHTDASSYKFDKGYETILNDIDVNNNAATTTQFHIKRESKEEKIRVEFIVTGLNIWGKGWAKDTDIHDEKIMSIELEFDRFMNDNNTNKATVKYAGNVLGGIEGWDGWTSSPIYANTVASNEYHVNKT